MPKSAATLRTLASLLQLSRATVSAALRDTGRISAATKARVRAAAQQAGYRHNPLAGALMSELRRSRTGTFRGVVAALELRERDRPAHGAFHDELLAGARERATKLGFKLEHLNLEASPASMGRINQILHSRNISGLLLLPSWHPANFAALDWSRFAGVYTDYNLVQPNLHSVCGEPYTLTILALERLRALGYRRPGLVIETFRNERLHRRHTAAYQAYYASFALPRPVPALVTAELSQRTFQRWFQRHAPDVVLCHFTDVLDWMEACGARVPDTHGFVCLNLLNRARPCTALDLQPREIGGRGMELVVAQLHSNARGIPTTATRTTIPPRWVEGPTTRPVAAN